jgi:hypothetical protein
MKPLVVRAGFVAVFALWASAVTLRSFGASQGQGEDGTAPVAPRLLAETGLFLADGATIDAKNRPYVPQYPLWSDGATKRRWIRLPEDSTIDTTNIDRWEFPVGTRFWKEFTFDGRRVETRFLWKAQQDHWVFASYAWNDAQTEAVLAPDAGIANVAEVAPGKRHSIPGVADCRSCHDSGRTEILGFDALQLSTDRDPNAIHGEPIAPGMVTVRTLVEERRVAPARTTWLTAPPRLHAPDPITRTALGYLSTNCGSCHNPSSSIASLGLFLKYQASAECDPALATSVGRTGHWVVPTAPDGESRIINPGHPELSALLARARSRRPASQMPPIGSVVVDREAVDLLTSWISGRAIMSGCERDRSATSASPSRTSTSSSASTGTSSVVR